MNKNPNSSSPQSFLGFLMCKSKMDTQVKQPKPKPKPSHRSHRTPTSTSSQSSSKPLPSTTTSSSSSSTINYNSTSTGTSTSNYNSTTSTISSKNSLSSLKDSLPETLHIYDFSEICTATNNFLSKRFSSSSSSACWRCTVRGKDVVVFQRKFRRSIEASHLHERLSMICRSHHISLIKLLGASVTSNDHIYLVYNYVNGSNLSDCLRNPRNPEFTVLSTWISRMQIATDLAQGLEYIHHYTGLNLFLVHNHIKSSSVLVTESFNAKICHFGTSELCGEIYHHDVIKGEIREEKNEEIQSSKFKRSDSGKMKFSGTRGYMSPEFQSTGIATQKSDVYAFGVVILELLSGEEPLRVKYDRETGDYRRVSVIETAREAVTESENQENGKIRRWVDRRLKDSFPVEVAEKITRLALDCVHVDEDKRPDMKRVAGKISRLYLQSKLWADKIRTPTEISVSLGPR